MFQLISRFRSLIWVAYVLLVLFGLVGMSRIGITPDNRVFYGPEDVRFQQLLEFEHTFRPNSQIAFVITCDEPLLACPKLVGAIRQTTELARAIDHVVKVDSLATYPYIVSSQDSIATVSYLDYVCPQSCIPDRAQVLNEPYIVKRFIDPQYRTAAVIATLDFDVGSESTVTEIYEKSNELIKSIDPALDARLVGTVPMMQAFVDATREELTGVLGIAFIVILLTLFVTLGNWRLTLVVVALGISTIVISLGAAGWTGITLNTASATIPLILFTIVIASSMHFFLAVVRAMGDRTHETVQKATAAALTSQTPPILLTALTTVVCMLSLITVSSPPVQDIGIWVSVGVSVGTILLLVVVPLLVANISNLSTSVWSERLQLVLNRYARRIERGRLALALVAALTLLASASIVRLDVDDDFVRYFDSSNQFRADTEFVAARLFGPNNIEIVVNSGEPEGVFAPEYIQFLQQLLDAVRQNSTIESAYSIIDVLEPLNRHIGNGDPIASLSRDLIAQLFLAYELSLEYGQSSFDLVDMSHSSTRISLLADDVTAKDVREFEKFVETKTAELNSPYKVEVTGESIPISHLSPRNIASTIYSILGTFGFTSIFLAIFFRDWRIAIIALVSTVVPVVCGFGVWGLFSDTIGLSTTVIIAVCMGIVIDDSIHMIYRFRDGTQRLDLEPREAAAYAVHRVGTAIVTTTVILGLGFVVMLFSGFELNSTFGGATAMILLFALVFDLLILPEMLVWRASGVSINT